MNIVCNDNIEVNPKRILERTFTLTICYTSLAYIINCTRHKDTVIHEKKALLLTVTILQKAVKILDNKLTTAVTLIASKQEMT